MRGPDLMTAEMLDVFTELSPTPAFLRNERGVYLWVNRAYAQLYDVPDPQGMIGQDVFAFDPPALATRHLEVDRQVLRTGEPGQHTLRIVRPNGAGEAIGRRFRVVLPDERSAVGGIYSDVTELVRAREHVRRLQQRNTVLFDRNLVAMAMVTPDGLVQEANAAFALLLGRAGDRIAGNRVGALLGPAAAALATTRGTSPATATVALTIPGGAPRPATVTVIPEADRTARLLTVQPRSTALRGPGTPFSARDCELIELIASGADNASIAEQVHLSRQGLDYHIRRLRQRLRANSRSELVARAYATGVLEPGTWPPSVFRADAGDPHYHAGR